MSILGWLLDPTGLTAHGFCLSWAPGLVALHAGSDVIIGLAYFSIPLALFTFVRKRGDLKFRWMIYLFMAFILACGATHFFSVLTLWVPVYGLEGLIKALTAVLSVITAMALWPLLPQALSLPSPHDVRTANQQLATMVDDLEQRVTERTYAVEEANTKLEATLEQRDKLINELTRSNLERGQFVNAASHDLREPVRMVSSFSQILLDEYAGDLDERGIEYMTQMASSAAHMAALLDDIVDLGRVDYEVTPSKWFSAEDILILVLKMFGERATIAKISHTPLPRIFGSSIQFHRLLQNLIGNALKYVATDVTPVIKISALRSGDYWIFSISDNGIGIAPRHFDQIFEPFKRLHNRSQHHGSGLGLAISRKIVERFGGDIAVSAADGGGAIFSFTVKIWGGDIEGADRGGPLAPHVMLEQPHVA